MSKKPPVKSLQEQIEKTVAHDTVIHPEDFVRPLVEEIQVEVTAPEVDLRTAESAQASLEAIQETARRLQNYQDRIARLRPLLEQRKFELGDGEVD